MQALTIVIILQGLMTQVRILITQLRGLRTLLIIITRGPLLVGSRVYGLGFRV